LANRQSGFAQTFIAFRCTLRKAKWRVSLYFAMLTIGFSDDRRWVERLRSLCSFISESRLCAHFSILWEFLLALLIAYAAAILTQIRPPNLRRWQAGLNSEGWTSPGRPKEKYRLTFNQKRPLASIFIDFACL
jgi:hypothetical protein